MKHVINLLFLVTPLFIFCQQAEFGQINNSRKPKTTEEKRAYFLELASSLQEQAEVPGVGIALVYEGRIQFTGGFGFSNLETKAPVTKNTLFMIGSTTKAFTGVVAAKQVEHGLLDWKTPIRHYLPNFKLSEPYIAKNVTMEDALIHMTGLARRDDLWKGKAISREEVFKQVETIPFEHSFRGTWDYNNHMYVVVGKVLETLAQQSWENLVEEAIFKPLGMTNSHTTFKAFIEDPKHAIGYEQDGQTIKPHINIDNIGPAGSISSTPEDASKWLSMLVNQGRFEDTILLQPKEFEYLTSPKGMSLIDTCTVRYYSVGWGANITKGKKYLRHSGAIAGQNAVVLVMPEDGFGIFVMTNQRSDYKDILVDYAEQIFVKNNFERDWEKEDRLRSNTFYIRFQNTLLEEGLDQAKALYDTFKYKNFEDQMNQLGYYLMEKEEMEKALLVFELNVKEHQNSANAYDSYGEALLKVKNKEAAIKMYKKSLMLDPTNENAASVLKQLQKK